MPTFPALAELVHYTGLAVAGLAQVLIWAGAGRGRAGDGAELELPFGEEIP